MRAARRSAGKDGDGMDEVLVSIRAAVLDDAEHAVGNILQRIHHTARVSLAGADAEHRDRVHDALGELERLLELLFDYVSPVEVSVRPTDAGRVASSMLSQVREHAGESVSLVGSAEGRVLGDPKALSRSFQLLGAALGDVWREASEVSFDVCKGEGGDGLEFCVRASGGETPVGAASRVGLAVAGRLIELQGGELHWDADGAAGACRVVLPRHGGRDDGL